MIKLLVANKSKLYIWHFSPSGYTCNLVSSLYNCGCTSLIDITLDEFDEILTRTEENGFEVFYDGDRYTLLKGCSNYGEILGKI